MSISFALLRASAFAGNPGAFCSGDETKSQPPDTAVGTDALRVVVLTFGIHSNNPVTGPTSIAIH